VRAPVLPDAVTDAHLAGMVPKGKLATLLPGLRCRRAPAALTGCNRVTTILCKWNHTVIVGAHLEYRNRLARPVEWECRMPQSRDGQRRLRPPLTRAVAPLEMITQRNGWPRKDQPYPCSNQSGGANV
jgi:hypothetical protein